MIFFDYQSRLTGLRVRNRLTLTRFGKLEPIKIVLINDNFFFCSQLTEATADLNEEQNTAHLASERIEAEQSERMRLEKEVAQLQVGPSNFAQFQKWRHPT